MVTLVASIAAGGSLLRKPQSLAQAFFSYGEDACASRKSPIPGPKLGAYPSEMNPGSIRIKLLKSFLKCFETGCYIAQASLNLAL